MHTAIIDKKTKEVLHTYPGMPQDPGVRINNYGRAWADVDLADHVEIPDPPKEYDSQMFTHTLGKDLKWTRDLDQCREEKSEVLLKQAKDEQFAKSPEGVKYLAARAKLEAAKDEAAILAVEL